MSEIRGLTARQPWAYAIASLGKSVENRDWPHPPNYRGLVAVHAAKGVDRDEFRTVADLASVPVASVERGVDAAVRAQLTR